MKGDEIRCKSMRAAMFLTALYLAAGDRFNAEAPLMELCYLCLSESSFPLGITMPQA